MTGNHIWGASIRDASREYGTALYDRFATVLELIFDGNPAGFVNHSFRHCVIDRP